VAGAVVRVADGRSGTTAHGQDHCELHPRKTLVVINPVHRFWVLGDVCLRGARAGLLFGWGPYLPASVTSVPIEPFRRWTFCAETIASRQDSKEVPYSPRKSSVTTSHRSPCLFYTGVTGDRVNWGRTIRRSVHSSIYTTGRAKHLRLAGTTYHGAHAVEVASPRRRPGDPRSNQARLLANQCPRRLTMGQLSGGSGAAGCISRDSPRLPRGRCMPGDPSSIR
jgi:hypothetical protein